MVQGSARCVENPVHIRVAQHYIHMEHWLHFFTELPTGKPLVPGRSVIRNEKARYYLTNMRRKRPIPFSDKSQNVDTLALRLLERMISFDSLHRPTAE
ncbi:hypothetical protein Tco_0277745 [Tanacetum coccineum]